MFHVLQAMHSFSAALGSGQLGPLMGQFGLGEAATNAAAAGGRYSPDVMALYSPNIVHVVVLLSVVVH